MPCIDTVQGFSFCPAAYQPRTSVYSGFSAANAIIQPKRQNHLQGFAAAFPLICHIPTHTIQQSHKPPAHQLRHVGGHHSAAAPPAYTRYHRHAGRCTSQHSRPIIIRYIRVQQCAPVIDPCQTVQHTTDHSSPAAVSMLPTPRGLRSGTGSARHSQPGGQSSSKVTAGGTTGGLSPHLFSGFRPIANRGQQ